MSKPLSKVVCGQPSWRISTPGVEAWLTELGGHLAPVTFQLGRRRIQPYAVAPWAMEKVEKSLPAVVKILRGDFFCLPFGGNAEVYKGERHPVHGDSANARWKLRNHVQTRDETSLSCELNPLARAGTISKLIRVVRGHSAVYCRHTIRGMRGPMPVGHHAMLNFTGSDGEPRDGRVSTSPISFAQTAPMPVELPENRGYSALKPDAAFESLSSVPTVFGSPADLSAYPSRRGYEDLVMLVSDAAGPFAWSAVAFPGEGFAWFAMKDPRVLRNTVLWFSNGGRHYAPWSGRHVNVLGIEETTSYFHYGLAPSARVNPLTRRGFPTTIKLSAKSPLVVNYIAGVVAIPRGFDRVSRIEPGSDSITLHSDSGRRVSTPVDLGFLRSMS